MSTSYNKSKSPFYKDARMKEACLKAARLKEPHMASQRGAILLVSMIMLLLITVVGVSAIGISSLDTKMTANSRDRQIAFLAAESGLREGENVIFTTRVLDEGVTGGYTIELLNRWWTSATEAWWTNNSEPVNTYTGQNAPLYVIELTTVGRGDAGNRMQDVGTGSDTRKTFYYTITSEGVGPGGSNVQLQSVYASKVNKTDWENSNDPIPEGKRYVYE